MVKATSTPKGPYKFPIHPRTGSLYVVTTETPNYDYTKRVYKINEWYEPTKDTNFIILSYSTDHTQTKITV